MHIGTIAILLSGAVMPALAHSTPAGPLDSMPMQGQAPSPASASPFTSATGWGRSDTAPLELSQVENPYDQRKKPDYLESVTNEAARTDPVGRQPRQSSTEAASGVTSPAGEPGRIDAIRGIVSEALATPSTENADREAKPTPPPVAKGRRERLQEAVVTAPTPEDAPGDNYISVLKDEVETTVVVDDGAPITPATGSVARAGRDVYFYTVREGESLWSIATRVYGDGFQWAAIYDANRDAIANANVLLVGQRLRIPK